MKTNDQLETLIQNLIERVNRIEADNAHTHYVVADQPKAVRACSDALEAIERAVAAQADTHRLITKIASQLGHGR